MRPSATSIIAQRLSTIDWPTLLAALDDVGYATIEQLLSTEDCNSLADLYSNDSLFRNRVNMARHNFGQGEYKYFNYPLPDLIGHLRTEIYAQVVSLANQWSSTMRSDVRYPASHADFLARCHEAGQLRPTPLLLKYEIGDYNCLHQDLYGEHVFPIQLTILLSEPGVDFSGGEFVFTEQRPRMQSRVSVVNLMQGDAVLFAVNSRPVQGSRGPYRVNMRHGVSKILSGQRKALGIIFHEAT